MDILDAAGFGGLHLRQPITLKCDVQLRVDLVDLIDYLEKARYSINAVSAGVAEQNALLFHCLSNSQTVSVKSYPWCAADVCRRSIMAFPDFGLSRNVNATAIAFSPDGSTLYIAAGFRVYSTNSTADSIPDWFVTTSYDNLCDMSVSPDGLSVWRRRVFRGWGIEQVFLRHFTA